MEEAPIISVPETTPTINSGIVNPFDLLCKRLLFGEIKSMFFLPAF